MYKYPHKNIRPFSAITDCNFGRKIIKTNVSRINANNICDELAKALVIHNVNAREIEYLERYYRNDTPMMYREKKVRPEINNKVSIALAYFLVETKTSEMAGEPIQYVLRGSDENKSEQIADLNTIMEGEDKAYHDIELCRWRSICGTAYRYISTNKTSDRLLDETPIFMNIENPMETFVCYYSENNRPAFSCQIRENENNETVYYIYTASEFFLIKDGKIISSALNGNKAIPVIEYPNNARRLSDIEITISITDTVNKLTSDRVNGVEQFVQSFIKFVNCEIDEDTFKKLTSIGCFAVKSNNGTDNKADVDIMTAELNQTQGQVVMDDLFNKFLIIQGLASRQSNTGGDTQGAVELRNGHYDAEKRAELSEPIFKKAERDMLRIVLNILRITNKFTLKPSDVEIKISRSKMDNMLVKAETLQILLNGGINPNRAIKTVGLFCDPEQVALESQDRMKVLYPTEIAQEVTANGKTEEWWIKL